jgi:5-(carboxyamino)imidazole ribonucleotide mutase
MAETRQVWIVMGSDSDAEIMKRAYGVLQDFGVPCKMMVSSAHRSPQRTADIARKAEQENVAAFIVGAGAAAHLAGVIASETPLPVIAVPIDATSLNGLDALLATVQMPGGVPVASMAIGKAGATNAGLFAVQMLAQSNPDLRAQYKEYKAQQAEGVAKKDVKLQEKIEKGEL